MPRSPSRNCAMRMSKDCETRRSILELGSTPPSRVQSKPRLADNSIRFYLFKLLHCAAPRRNYDLLFKRILSVSTRTAPRLRYVTRRDSVSLSLALALSLVF